MKFINFHFKTHNFLVIICFSWKKSSTFFLSPRDKKEENHVKELRQSKVQIFWEGKKIWKNLLFFKKKIVSYQLIKKVGDFWGLLRTSGLYQAVVFLSLQLSEKIETSIIKLFQNRNTTKNLNFVYFFVFQSRLGT